MVKINLSDIISNYLCKYYHDSSDYTIMRSSIEDRLKRQGIEILELMLENGMIIKGDKDGE